MALINYNNTFEAQFSSVLVVLGLNCVILNAESLIF